MLLRRNVQGLAMKALMNGAGDAVLVTRPLAVVKGRVGMPSVKKNVRSESATEAVVLTAHTARLTE